MSRLLLLFIASVVLLPVPLSAAEKLPKPDRVPGIATEAQRQLIAEGIAFHDAQEYDQAIAKYTQVREVSPDVVQATYELAFTYYAQRDYDRTLTLTREGMRYKSEVLPRFYVMFGNCLDDLGKPGEAIDVYKAAIKMVPATALLHFNLGLSLTRAGKHAEAKAAMQQSARLDPRHASTQYVLASIYTALGYRVPAILALSRFLLIEPNSTRAQQASVSLDRLMGGGVAKSEGSNEINITLTMSPQSLKDEGDFDSAELAMSMSAALGQTDAVRKESSPFKSLTAIYSVLAETISDAKGNGFAAKYYAPFFAEMDKREFVPAFVAQAFQSGQLAGASEWEAENAAKVREFQQWLSAYRWPTTK